MLFLIQRPEKIITGKILCFNETSYFEEDKFTERQLVDLAKKNAQEKHIGALWSLFGLTGVPSSAFGSVLGLLILLKLAMEL